MKRKMHRGTGNRKEPTKKDKEFLSREAFPMDISASDREKIIVKTSVTGILTNACLSAFKMAVGLISHSIAVVLDGVNNLSDALSSIITIIGTKLAGKAPDRKHPLGHGRIEYLSAMIVSALILYAGITALVESVRKILHPEEADYSVLTLVMLAVAIIAKIFLGRYVKRQGERVHSGALIASGSDASFDAILSASVLASALIFLLSGVSLEAYVGVVIACFILRAGIHMMTETLSAILGQRADAETTRKVREILNSEPEIRGAYDLILHNYGPDRNYASVHVELPDSMTVAEVDTLTHRVEAKVYSETGVILTGVGIYSYNTGNDEAAKIRNKVQEIVLRHDWALQMHGFYVDMEEKAMHFDVVLDFEADKEASLRILSDEIRELYPEYTVAIVPDVDISD